MRTIGESPAAEKVDEDSAKPRVAVLEFTGVDASAGEVAAATDQVRTELVRTNRFDVLERAQISAVLDELALQQSGLTEAQATDVGRLLNAEYIVTGRLIKAGPNSYFLSVQGIDVESGQIVIRESASHEGSIVGFLNRLPPLVERTAAKVFGEPVDAEPPDTAALSEDGLPALTFRIYGGPLTALYLDIGDADFDIIEGISADAVSVGYEQFVTQRISVGAALHLGRIDAVSLRSAPGAAQQSLGADGTYNLLSLGASYNFFPGSWVIGVGGAFYFAALDYHFRDIRFSGGADTHWSINASGLLFRFAADYVIPTRWFLGLGFDGDLASSYSGSRIDEYKRSGEYSSGSTTVTTIVFRGGYNF